LLRTNLLGNMLPETQSTPRPPPRGIINPLAVLISRWVDFVTVLK